MKKKISMLLLLVSLVMCTLAGCGTNPAKTEETDVVSTICEDVIETSTADEDVTKEEIIEEDLSGIVPLSKRINKGNMIAFGCIGDIHNGYVHKIFFFDRGKVTIVQELMGIGEYEGFTLDSLETLVSKTDEELWTLCDEFKMSSEEYVQAIINNSENTYRRLTDPNSADFDISFTEAVTSQPDSGEIYDIVLPVIDAPFVISVETDETNSIVQFEQVVIAAQRISKTYGGTESVTGAIDMDLYFTNIAEGGEVEIGNMFCGVYPIFETNLSGVCIREGEGVRLDELYTLDASKIFINNKENAYEYASELLVK